MRKDLVADVLAAAADEMFEDVLYTPVTGGPAVLAVKSIFGVEKAVDRIESFGQRARAATHTTLALRAAFPLLAKGDRINDGAEYEVLDFEPDGDGRFEIRISLRAL